MNKMEMIGSRKRAAKEANFVLTQKSLDYIRSAAARHGARRVFLFGSCLTLPESDAGDIDLAIEGLGSVGFYALWDDLMWAPELDKKRVDLVRVEDDLPVMVIVRSEGVCICDNSREYTLVPL